jgi:recombination protein RecA
MDKNEKLKKLDNLFKETQKKFGREVVIKYDEKENLNIKRTPLESLGLRYIFGGEGLPKGRIIETYGEPSHGKSSVANIIASDVQKRDGYVVYIDFEHSFDFSFSKKLGMNVDEEQFKLFLPDTLEDGLQLLEDICTTRAVDLVIWDSTNSAKAKREDEGEFGDANMGVNAKLYSTGLKRLVSKISKSGTSVILISQKRQKIGAIYSSPDVIGVGTACAFYSSIRFEVRRKEPILNDDKQVIGYKTRVKCIKNKTAPPNREYIFDFYNSGNVGIDYYSELADFAISYHLIEKTGSWYTLPNKERVQGKDNITKYYKDNPIEYKNTKEQIIKLLNVDDKEGTLEGENEVISEQKEIKKRKTKE